MIHTKLKIILSSSINLIINVTVPTSPLNNAYHGGSLFNMEYIKVSSLPENGLIIYKEIERNPNKNLQGKTLRTNERRFFHHKDYESTIALCVLASSINFMIDNVSCFGIGLSPDWQKAITSSKRRA